MASAKAEREPSAKEIRLVIAASSAGTVFEWYDFFIYGTLAAIIGKTFFPSGNATLETLLVWAGFAVGFGFRPLRDSCSAIWAINWGANTPFWSLLH